MSNDDTVALLRQELVNERRKVIAEVVDFLKRAYHVRHNKAARALAVHPADAVQREFGTERLDTSICDMCCRERSNVKTYYVQGADEAVVCDECKAVLTEDALARVRAVSDNANYSDALVGNVFRSIFGRPSED